MTGVAFHPTKNLVASCSCDKSVKLWNADTGAELWTVKGDGAVWSVDWSPCGTMIAAACNDEEEDDYCVKILNSETGALLCDLKAHSDFVRAVAWSPCGQWLASGGDDNMVYVYDAKTFEVKWPLNVGYAFSRCSTRIFLPARPLFSRFSTRISV